MSCVSELSFVHNRAPNKLNTERTSSNPTTEKPILPSHPQPEVESIFCKSGYIDKSFDFRSNQWYGRLLPLKNREVEYESTQEQLKEDYFM